MGDREREKIVGSITTEYRMNKVRVPVFREMTGGRPYYYSPMASKKKKIYVEGNFKFELTGKRRRLHHKRRLDNELAKKGIPGHGRVHYNHEMVAQLASMTSQDWTSVR